ncbi:riboflavin synthase [Haladaptatus sp. F3-133]|uniref:Riboflavin synthase n=1 Tax=Halorutilus salinus TaxID=2487751 RepID=A0A9Q4C3B2_9EURY|nr:riboflavin synthase [Halorutilus salinus]MCX2818185.1 riboflavin synthase [Halorutilus salinus]
MFTGIVEETGRIDGIETDEDGVRMRLEASFVPDRGGSVAVNGACLTAESTDDEGFDVFVAEETLDKTWLGELDEGDEVNLERAMRADGRFDGHIVQGHVDTTTRVVDTRRIGEDWEYVFEVPEGFERYVVGKGSVTLDGVSLTVAELDGGEFTVAVVPETYSVTNFSEKGSGDPVNFEVDIVAKYVESTLDGRGDVYGGVGDESGGGQ